MRLPSTAHTSQPWRIHEFTRDFRLEDVWALPTPGGPDDFPRLVHAFASGDLSRGSSRAARTLWAIRRKAGELKPNGLLGAGYMAVIAPFRHRIVYPPMLRAIGRAWR
jgi:hypothetical protein